ncbi:hypothetical protein H2C83_09285 [Thermoactinomyces sp. AMNI-1]|uniref:Uncharacterized protein n=2 Tax=Thermoactinomyces mirandus TaxID=2756294 RepID=A0A7W1XSJ8_9BACL|nr:hypothetical protein [Thermoactinomyces mirandus]
MTGIFPNHDKKENRFSALKPVVSNRYYLEDYPRLPEETDDSGRFRRVIAAMPPGSLLIVPEGHYYADEICIRKPISIRFAKETVVEAIHINASYIFKWEGGLGYHSYCLAKDLKRGDRSFRILQTPWDLEAGDMIVLTDDSKRYSDGQANVNAEVHEIDSIYSSARELLPDSGFSSSQHEWNRQSNLGECVSFSWDPHESAFKMELDHLSKPGFALIERQAFGIRGGMRYNLQVYGRLETRGSVVGSCYVSWLDEYGRLLAYSNIMEFDHSCWKRITNGNLLAPAGAASARVAVAIHAGEPGYGGCLRIREVSLKSAVTKIVLKDEVRLPKRVSSRQNVYKVKPLQDVSIENFHYRLKEGSRKGFGILAFNMRRFRVSGFRGERGAESAIQIQRSKDVIVEDFDIKNPQVVGSGQGYGIQFYGGNQGVVVRNGYTRRMRHSVDFEGTFDALVENVVDEKGKGASFMISHNGWCSDITFSRCKSLQSHSSGFVAEAQGVKDPYDLKHHNIHINHCVWHRAIHPDDPVGYGFGVLLKAPVSGKIAHFTAKYGNGEKPSMFQDNGAIRLLPTCNHLLIEHVVGEGLRRGVAIVHPAARMETEPRNKLEFRHIYLRKCRTGFFVNDGERKRLFLYDIQMDGISEWLFGGNRHGTYERFVLDGLTVTHCNQAGFMQKCPQAANRSLLQGRICRIESDQCGPLDSLEAGWSLTWDDCMLRGDGETVWFTGNMKNSCASGIPDGIVDGQRLLFISKSMSTFTIYSKNILYRDGENGITLSPKQRLALLVWQDGKHWVHIS